MKTLKEFDFGTQRARSSRYDWDKILDGEIRVLEAGKDFECKTITIRSRARQVANKLGLGVRTAVDGEGNVVIQSYEMSNEEKEFKAAKDKERKAAKAAESDDSDDEGEQEAPKKRVRRRKAS